MKLDTTAHDLLEADHGELDILFEKVFAAVESADCGAAFETLDLFWARLAMHIRAEHLCLFPAIRDAAGVDPEILAVLDQLRHDHDFFMTQLARAIKALRLTYNFGNEPETLNVVSNLITAVRDRLIDHNVIEEQTVYPLVDSLSNPDQLAAAVQKELDNYPARFATEAR